MFWGMKWNIRSALPFSAPRFLDGRTPRCHTTSKETYSELENSPHLPGPTNLFFLPYTGHRTPQETIPLSVPLFPFFLFSFFPVFGIWSFLFLIFCLLILTFVFWLCFLGFLFFVLCLLCYLEFVFFHLINYFTTTFIRNSLNSLVLLNLFSYDLLYFTFVFLYIICICICYFA